MSLEESSSVLQDETENGPFSLNCLNVDTDGGLLEEKPSLEPPSVSSVIIFHPGSRYLRFGRASESPLTILHAIGRKRKQLDSPKNDTNIVYRDTLLPLGNRNVSDSNYKVPPEVESARLQLCHTLQTSLRTDGSSRFATPTKTISEYNKLSKIENLDCKESWEDFSDQKVIIGDDILKLNPESDFNIHFPWRRGQLNLHKDIGGSLSSVVTDLGDIWTWCVVEKLKIPVGDLKNFKAVVIIPAMFEKVHAKEIMNVMINSMGFGSAFLVQDHVCATFGAGLACPTVVVDVGDQKISVSCVEDGISYPQSRIELKYGCGDVTIALWNLMSQGSVPFPIDLTSLWDVEFINQLKEKFCHFDLNRCGPEQHEIIYNKPGETSARYNIYLGDELLIAPLSYFNPDLLRGSISNKSVVVYRTQATLADDPSAYITETSRRGLKEAEGDVDEDDLEDSKEITISQPISKIDTNKLLGIEQAILQSIDSCNQGEELKRRLYSSILIVGGGFKFKGLGTWLQNKISMNIPRIYKSDLLEIITEPKEGDPALAVWKGASILVSLETAAELWITRQEWKDFGFRILREKSLISF